MKYAKGMPDDGDGLHRIADSELRFPFRNIDEVFGKKDSGDSITEALNINN